VYYRLQEETIKSSKKCKYYNPKAPIGLLKKDVWVKEVSEVLQ